MENIINSTVNPFRNGVSGRKKLRNAPQGVPQSLGKSPLAMRELTVQLICVPVCVSSTDKVYGTRPLIINCAPNLLCSSHSAFAPYYQTDRRHDLLHIPNKPVVNTFIMQN